MGTLEREANLSLVGIDSQNLDFHGLAALDDVLWVLDLVIGQLGNVEQTLQAVFQADKDTEVGDLGDFALNHHARLVVLGDGVDPWIFGELLHAETDTLLVSIDFENHALDGVALLVLLVRVGNLFGPRHVGDVKQTVDAGLNLNKRAVVGNVADLTHDDGAHGVLLADEFPWVDFGLLDAKRNLTLLVIDFQDDHFDFLAHFHHFGWMVDPACP